MALCEHCRAELATTHQKMPAPWFDEDRRTVAGVPFCPVQWEMLLILWRRRGKYVSRDSLMTLLYGSRPDDPPQERVLSVYACYLRRALRRTPYAIEHRFGLGYRLCEQAEVAPPILIGDPEFGVPPPPPPLKGGAVGDKYGLKTMRIGQSRVVRNATLEMVASSCTQAVARGLGLFRAGHDAQGHIRIWCVG